MTAPFPPSASPRPMHSVASDEIEPTFRGGFESLHTVGTAWPLPLWRNGRPVEAALGFAAGVPPGGEDAMAARNLHLGELRRYRELHHEKRRASFLLGRCASKHALGLLLGESRPEKIEVGSGVFNQPLVLEPERGRGVTEITLTHTSDRALALAYPTGHPMGVDLEVHDPSRLETFRREMTGAEAESIAGMAEYPATALWAMIWTAKEALSKALRCGLTVPLPILELSKLKDRGGGYLQGEFRFFGQYKCLCWLLPGHAISMVLPKNTELGTGGPLHSLTSSFHASLWQPLLAVPAAFPIQRASA